MAMANRTAKFVAAIFASFLAGANFAAVAENAAKPADSCLSGPKGAVPAGGHWYYRIDRATKRHCWYIGEEKDKTAAAVPRDAAAPWRYGQGKHACATRKKSATSATYRVARTGNPPAA